MAPKKKPKFEYSHEQLEQALEAYRKGENAFSVSKRFGVPRSTLIYKASGKTPINKERRLGPAPRIGFNAEGMLKNWVMALAVRGFPIRKIDLLTSVQQILKDMRSEHLFPEGRPGPTWLALFLKRNPEISQRTVEKLSKIRANVTEHYIKTWFDEVEGYLRKNNLLAAFSDPSRIFNMDETAFFLCPKGEKVLGVRGQKNVYEVHSSNEKENITVLANINASGAVAPSLVVLPCKRFPQAAKLNMPDEWAMGKSENGWITGEVFYEYFVNYFYPWLVEKKMTFPIIVFLDGHKSHLTYNLSSFCADHEIVLVALPANCTHIMQPLDVAVFRPVKKGWSDAVHSWRMKNGGDRLTKYNFSPMLKEVFDLTMKKETIVNGFKRCGISPLDRNSVDYSKVDVCNNELPKQKEDLVKDAKVGGKVLLEHTSGQGCIDFMESFISPEMLQQFKATYSEFTPIWRGEESCHDLYVVWKKAKDWSLGKSSQQYSSALNNESLPGNVSVEPSTSISGNEPHLDKTPNKTSDQPPKDVSSKEKLAKVLSPQTNGANVPSPFKKNLFWPEPQGKPTRKGKNFKEKLPSVVSSKEWRQYEEKKQEEKKKEEEMKAEKKRLREEKKMQNTKNKKKKLIYDSEDDWTCKVCNSRYSSELIIGGTTSRRWIECDICKSAYHYKCIPKAHLNVYGIEDTDEDDDEIAFVCHICSPDTDDDLLVDEDESD